MKKVFLLSLFFLSYFFILNAQTDGTLSFTIRTIAKTSSNYSPKHVLAMWVEDANGKLVKNLELSAAKRKQYLYTWNAKSGGNAVDITSGSTLSSHITHTKTWNCRDKAGVLVPDGTYKIITEFTSEHAQGPLNTVSFTKEGDKIIMNPVGSSFFSDINLEYTPAGSTGFESEFTTGNELVVYPNPVKDLLNISFTTNSPSKIKISLYSMNMQLISLMHESIAQAGRNEINWTRPSGMPGGSYLLILQSDRFILGRKMIFTDRF